VKRALALVALLAALPALADKWVDDYNRGLAAVRAKNYAAGADALQAAVGVMPNEAAQIRVHNEIFTYVPHFWLGIARFNLGDIDGAQREWKTSEEQGVVQNTIYYAKLREWQATAKEVKQRNAENAAAASKREANAAVARAVTAQAEAAVVTGADHSDAYRAAQRKLQEALDAFNKAGVDVRAYKRAGELAGQARELFASSAEEARKLKAMRPPAPAPQPQPQPAVVIPFSPQPQPQPPPVAVKPKETLKPVVVEPQPPVVSEALVSARIAVQQYRRRLIDHRLPVKEADRFEHDLAGSPDANAIDRVVAQVAEKERELDRRAAEAAATKPPTKPEDIRPALESAYRAFAVGDFNSSESMLTHILDTHASGEAYLLRGCARYTRAMLARNAGAVLDAAAADFREALKINGALRIDTSAFSPKLVKFFDDVKSAR